LIGLRPAFHPLALLFLLGAGLTFDIHLQKKRKIYSGSQLGNIPLRGILAFVALAQRSHWVLSLPVTYSEKVAATAMSALLLVNVIGWRISPGAGEAQSSSLFATCIATAVDFFSLEQLDAIAS